MAKDTITAEDAKPSAKKQSKRLEDLHARAVKRFKELEEYWSDNRDAALADIKFASGDQWPEKVKAAREKKGRPCLVLDKLSQYEKQVVNDGRQNRPSIKYRPVDDGGDPKVAEGFQGITRHILTSSNADEAFDNALGNAARSGFGFFRVLTEYEDEGSFNQEIKIRRVRNPLSVLLGPHQLADGSDADDGFIIDDISRESFKRQFPKAEKCDWKSDGKAYSEGWLTELTVRVAEYWYKEPGSGKLHLLSDGTTALDEDYARDQRQNKPTIVRSRDVQTVKVKWCRMSGAEILEEREWAGKYIPILPVYGEEMDINGKVTYLGLYRRGKDGQTLHNFSRSAYAERVALAPKAPYVAAAGQIEGHPEWKTANTENHMVLPYTPQEINGTPLPPPRREQASDIPAGFAQDAQMAEHDIQASIGMYNASLGAQSNEKSGKAIIARQREGDVATFHYHDNLNRAVRYLGRILVDLIPKVYDTKRVVRIVKEDGEVEMAMVNPDLPDAYAKLPPKEGAEPLPVFNLNAGRYDVDVSAGPSYTTQRQEQADAMLELARNNPTYWQTHGDLIVRSQDWHNAEEFAERTKAVMPPELKAAIAQAEAEEDMQEEGGPSPEVAAIMKQAQLAVQERDAQIEQMGQMLEQAKQAVLDLQEQAKTAEQRAMEAADIKSRELAIKDREVGVKEAESRAKLAAVGIKEQQFDPETGEPLPEAPDPIIVLADAIAMQAEAITKQTPQLVAAILAPRESVAIRDEFTGRVTGAVSTAQPIQ